MDVNEFLVEAGGRGSSIGVHLQSDSPLIVPDGVEARRVDGAEIPTLDRSFDVFASAWHFPPWFGRNIHALDDFMRDLDSMIEVALGKPPAPGYLTEIVNAQFLFDEEPNMLSFFARHILMYRDYYRDEAYQYRDEANPRASFGLLLSAPADHLGEVEDRCRAAGVDVVRVVD